MSISEKFKSHINEGCRKTFYDVTCNGNDKTDTEYPCQRGDSGPSKSRQQIHIAYTADINDHYTGYSGKPGSEEFPLLFTPGYETDHKNSRHETQKITESGAEYIEYPAS